MIGNSIKSLIFLTLTAFALIGLAAVLPEAAWEKTPAKLHPLRTLLAENGLISAQFAQASHSSAPSVPNPDAANLGAMNPSVPNPSAASDRKADSLCIGGVCPVRIASRDESAALTLEPPRAPVPQQPSRLDVRPLEPLAAQQENESESLLTDETAAHGGPSPLSADTLPDLSFDELSSNPPEPVAEGDPKKNDLAWNDRESPVSTVSGVISEPALPPLQSIDAATLPTNSAAPSADDTAARLERAIARSVEPSAAVESFLELNRILAERGELLSPNDRVRLNLTLDRLAFEVFYNPKSYLLEPEYRVAQGETLEQIARKYAVSPEFLAVLNQLALPNDAPLPVGSSLKVVRGPVGAVVSFKRMELLLTFNGLYAGRFKMGCTERAKTVRGPFTVTRKVVRPEYNGPLDDGRIGKIPAGDARNPLGPCWIELDGGLGLQGTNHPEYIGQSIAPVGGLIFSNQDITHLNILLGAGTAVTLMD